MLQLALTLALAQHSPAFLLRNAVELFLPWDWKPFSKRAGDPEIGMGPWCTMFDDIGGTYLIRNNTTDSEDYAALAFDYWLFRPAAGKRQELRIAFYWMADKLSFGLSLRDERAETPRPGMGSPFDGFRARIQEDPGHFGKYQWHIPIAFAPGPVAYVGLGIVSEWREGVGLPKGKYWLARTKPSEGTVDFAPAIPADFEPGERPIEVWAKGDELTMATARIEGEEVVVHGWRFEVGRFARWMPAGLPQGGVRVAVQRRVSGLRFPGRFPEEQKGLAVPTSLFRVGKTWWMASSGSDRLVELPSGRTMSFEDRRRPTWADMASS